VLKRDEWLPGVPCWVDTEQPDPAAAAEFYGGLFGWEYDERYAPGADVPYRIAMLHGLEVGGIGPSNEHAPPVPMWNTYVRVVSADRTADAVRDAGGSVVVEPFTVGPAGRAGVFADPAGAAFSVWEPGATRGAQLVNDPGTWNFSGLLTNDVEGAKRFYADVFGWDARPFDPEAGSFFWRRPGYIDQLEEINPGTREQFASVGAPEGFEDAVAWVAPTEDGVAPFWSVVFSVDDADAVAARAEELGGRVLAPPSDAPWVRTTTLQDPQGAVFTANKFVPPEG
jgi:predicted enzyme related to lactoylglutathione lyase